MEIFSTVAAAVVRLFEGAASSTDWIPLAFIFAAVLCAVLGAFIVMRPVTNIGSRISGPRPATLRQGAAVSLRNDQSQKAFDQVLRKLEKFLVQTNDQARSRLKERMMQAGYLNERASRIYYIMRVVLAVTLPVGFLIISTTHFPNLETTTLMLMAGGLTIVGLYLPWRFIQSRVESRQLAITEGFPDSLDLLVICVESGLALDAALVRVSQELARAHPVLAEQIGMVTLELKTGMMRAEALRNFATRTGVQDVKNFVTLLIQSEALGADLSETLRVQAEEMRALRMIRAEEKAHKLPVKLSVALVMFILPAMFAVVLGPAIITIMRDVMPHLGK